MGLAVAVTLFDEFHDFGDFPVLAITLSGEFPALVIFGLW